MNKLVKGSIAGAAGIALLLGGAGTLALWNDSATIGGGTVSTGELNLTSNGDGAWDQTVALLVPGDVVTYTETFAINAAGDNLAAELSAVYADGTSNGVTTTTTVSIATLTPVAGVYSFTEGTYTATVTVEVAFDAVGTDNQNIAGQVLGDVIVSLTQV